MTIDKKTIQVCDAYNIIERACLLLACQVFLDNSYESQTQYHYQYMAIVHSSANDR